MAALQRVGSSGYASCVGLNATEAVSEQFPVGLRVLVVDDDVICLKIVERMLRRCLYSVTTCSQATAALNILRERKGCFDVVLSDVHMPDMDGYKLLEHVGLEMDLPVIMMSADTRTSAVMKSVKHGACDYLIKPIREEELKNIWQHVLRERCIENKEHDECSGSFEDNDWHKRGSDEVEYASSVNEAPEGVMRSQKKRSNTKDEDDVEQETDDPSTSKKPRVVWSVELHQQFVSAVNQLGIDKAVPKRILELMNVPGLTRENVASHLQKFRLYLKRLSGVAQQRGMPNAFCGPLDSGVKLNPLGRFDIQALAASGQIPPETLAALHAELFDRPANGVVSAADQANLLQVSLQSLKCISVEQGIGYGQPLVKCQPNLSKSFSRNAVSMEEIAAGFGAWPSATVGGIGPSSNCGANLQNGNTLMDMVLRQQQQQPQQPKQQLLQQSSVLDANLSINVQPSCDVVPSHSASIQAGNIPALANQRCNRSVILDYSLLSQSSNSREVGTFPNRDVKAPMLVSRYSGLVSVSPSMSSNSVNGEAANWAIQSSAMTYKSSRDLSGHALSSSNNQATYSAKAGELVDQGLLKSLGFVGKGTFIPTRFAGEDLELQEAVPKRILELMNVPGLTRENVASHLQKVEEVVQPSYRSEWNKNKVGNNVERKLPHEIFTESHRELLKEGSEWMKGTANSYTIVAALVVTIAFVAAFTVPGGTNGDTGAPIFLLEISFMVFTISNMLAFFSSATSLMMFLGILTSRYSQEDFLRALPLKLSIGLISLFFSITSMLVAFTAGIHVMVSKHVPWIAIPAGLLACVSATLFGFLQAPLLVEVVYSTYGPSIFGPKTAELLI